MATRGEKTKEGILSATEDLVLNSGFAGTSIEDILTATGLTKGAFFYHFKSKQELGRDLAKRYWQNSQSFFNALSDEANSKSDDPLQSTLILFDLLAEALHSTDDVHGGCLFACYLYEHKSFDEDVKMYMTEAFEIWADYFESRFNAVFEKYKPISDTTPKALSEMIMCIIEGAYILSKAHQDPEMVSRQIRNFRNHLTVLFSH